MRFKISVPILGFEDVKEVELEKIDDTFMKMISCEDENVSFTMINPFILREYDFEVPENIKELLTITDKSNLVILNIMLIQTPIEDSMINFIGPIVFNTDTNQAAQIIISDNKTYGVAEKVADFISK